MPKPPLISFTSFICFIKETIISFPLVSELLCNEKDCVICLCQIRRGQKTDCLKCKHVFHKQCFHAWIERSKGQTCPVCRDSLIGCSSSAMKKEEGDDGALIGRNNIIIISPFGNSRRRDLCWIR